jgi:hypothetical protein
MKSPEPGTPTPTPEVHSAIPSIVYIAGPEDTLNIGREEYSPGDIEKIDKAIRHMPYIVAYMQDRAQDVVDDTGSGNYEVVLQNDANTQRPRAYVAPSNNKGIHEELSEHLALKAAINMEGR